VVEGCRPVEVRARRGPDTLCYGPLKPVGRPDPRTGRVPHAVAQLRRDNAQGSIYNLVGFQTHLKFPEQKRVFSMIPALRGAEFVRYGVMHRNTYLDSPRLLNRYYQVREAPRLVFAGQITGVEGYVESTASGLLAGLELMRRRRGAPPLDFPRETAIGALAAYVSNPSVIQFQPMNINFGILSPLPFRARGKRNKNQELSRRALAAADRIAAVLQQPAD
jgi:methylenetetrahydrofolate--tRNA-(uracil-5-)-methyltransferase